MNSNLVEAALNNLQGVVSQTPCEFNKRLSDKYKASVYLKREDLQLVRSYKLRGAYNKISSLSSTQNKRGIVCASAGNHAQGVAFSCNLLKIKGYIYMPNNTPKQKVERIKSLGGKWIKLEFRGNSYDEAQKVADQFCKKTKKVFIHPFDDPLVIAGQGTVACEIFKQVQKPIDFIIVPIGGGGLASGIGLYAKNIQPNIKIIGAEPQGAPSMLRSLKAKKIISLQHINTFVDGAAVKTPGKLTFKICSKVLNGLLLADEGKICQEMISLYQQEGIVTEPAGALAISILDEIKTKIKGKTVVCIVSGGNNDILRYPEIVERSLIYQGLKHYFLVEFPQRPGTLRKYLDNVLGPNDDITLFEYIKRSEKESGPVLIGIELSRKENLPKLLKNMQNLGFSYEKIEHDNPLFKLIV